MQRGPRPKEGIKLLLEINAWDGLPKRLSHLWMDAGGYTAEGKGAETGCTRCSGMDGLEDRRPSTEAGSR